jgi:elongation factor P
MIGVQDLRKGVTFEFENNIYRVLQYEHIKTGRGGATIRIKARDLRSGATIDRTFPSGNRVQDIRLDHATVQYLYHEGDMYTFMDLETYDQPMLTADVLGDAVNYLKPEMTLDVVSYEGKPIDIELPTTVDMEVTYTEPGICRRHRHRRHQERPDGDRAEGAGAPLRQRGRHDSRRHPQRRLRHPRLVCSAGRHLALGLACAIMPVVGR